MSHASVIVAVEVKDPSDMVEVQAAVDFQMAPFDENGEWFRDASRWDWYVIGGRYTGLLSGYEPDKDPANYETCFLCHGTGQRTDVDLLYKGCNGCAGSGKSLKFNFSPHQGDVARIKDVARRNACSYAFLRNREWHEMERLGWFGGSISNEATMASPMDEGTLLNKVEISGDERLKIHCWNEPWESWEKNFWSRFIDPLPPETVLVVVDYHV